MEDGSRGSLKIQDFESITAILDKFFSMGDTVIPIGRLYDLGERMVHPEMGGSSIFGRIYRLLRKTLESNFHRPNAEGEK